MILPFIHNCLLLFVYLIVGGSRGCASFTFNLALHLLINSILRITLFELRLLIVIPLLFLIFISLLFLIVIPLLFLIVVPLLFLNISGRMRHFYIFNRVGFGAIGFCWVLIQHLIVFKFELQIPGHKDVLLAEGLLILLKSPDYKWIRGDYR